jgi:hypothetical protein
VSRALKRVGWLRRNRRALLAILVLLPATLGIVFANQWIGYFDEWPSRPVNATAGDTLDYGNANWQVEPADHVSGDSAQGRERNLPAGTDLVVVTVDVDPTGTGPDGVPDLCSVRLEESGGGAATRSWANVPSGSIPLDGAGPELTSCSSELSTPYSFDAEFVVPADAGEDTTLAVHIIVAGELPEYARFTLNPVD